MPTFRIELQFPNYPPGPVLAGIIDACLNAGVVQVASAAARNQLQLSFQLLQTPFTEQEIQMRFTGIARQYDRSFQLRVIEISDQRRSEGRAGQSPPLTSPN